MADAFLIERLPWSTPAFRARGPARLPPPEATSYRCRPRRAPPVRSRPNRRDCSDPGRTRSRARAQTGESRTSPGPPGCKSTSGSHDMNCGTRFDPGAGELLLEPLHESERCVGHLTPAGVDDQRVPAVGKLDDLGDARVAR